MVKALPAFLIGLVAGGIGIILSLFIIIQFDTVNSDDFRFIPKTAWFEWYPVDCIEDLCNIKWLATYYNSSIIKKEPNLGNLEGVDFQTTTQLIKQHFGQGNIEIVDVRYALVGATNCEKYECFDHYVIEFQVRGDEGISILREFAERPSEKPYAPG
ncbi:MAG TPA: hypothetical protein VIB07_00845 [Nitrososphaera sp.]